MLLSVNMFPGRGTDTRDGAAHLWDSSPEGFGVGADGWETISAGRSMGDPSRQVQPAHGTKQLGPGVCRGGQLNRVCARTPV